MKYKDDLRLHACDCVFTMAMIEKAKIKEVEEWQGTLENTSRYLYRKSTSRICYFLVTVVLFFLTVDPSEAQTFKMITDDW